MCRTSPKFSVLNDCVHAYMAETGELKHEDVMRAFFRTKVAELGQLIRRVVDVIKMSAEQTKRDITQLLPEANQIVIVSPSQSFHLISWLISTDLDVQTTLQEALEFRNQHTQVYGIELPMMSAWTSRTGIIETVLSLFELTTKALDNAPADSGRRHSDDQLPQLAALLFVCISERLEWLSSDAAKDEPNVKQQREELEQRFTSLRPEVLETLRMFSTYLKNGQWS